MNLLEKTNHKMSHPVFALCNVKYFVKYFASKIVRRWKIQFEVNVRAKCIQRKYLAISQDRKIVYIL